VDVGGMGPDVLGDEADSPLVPALADTAAGVATAMSFDAVVHLDGQGRLLAWNRTAEHWLGMKAGDLGRQHVEVLPLEGAEQERGTLPAVLAGTRSATVNSRRVNTWGEEVAVEVRLEPLAGGGAVVITRDRSREADLTAALGQSEERAGDLQALASTGIWVWDPGLDNVQWSQQMFELTGCRPEDFEGTLAAHLDVVPDGERDGVRQVLQHALLSGEPVTMSHQVRRPDGGLVWVDVRARSLQTGHGRGVVGVWRDSTEGHLAEARLVEANEALQRFAASAAHDLKSPLGIISSMGSLAIARYAEQADPTLLMLVGRIIDNADMAIEMVQALVQSARVGAGNVDIIELDEVCSWVEDMLRPRLVAEEVDYARASLPRVLGDSALLRQLMLNLVTNAIKYRHPDRPLQIRVDATSEGKKWRIAVRDNGTGIDPADRAKVFDEGFRTATVEDVEGHGHGLAQCRNIVLRHGGKITVADGMEGGIAVEFTLLKLPSDLQPGPSEGLGPSS